MRLHDVIHHAAPLHIQTPDDRIWRNMPSPYAIQNSILNASSRYVLNDDAAALVSRTAFGEDKRLNCLLDFLRFPVATQWVEWNDSGRYAALERLGLLDDEGSAHKAHRTGRAGAYIDADSDGRRGEIHVIWETVEGGADLSPFIIDFDLNQNAFNAQPDATSFTRTVRFDNADVLNRILSHARFRMRPAWLLYYRQYASSALEFEKIIRAGLANVAGDFLFVAAFFIVVLARGAFNMTPQRLDRLNTTRRRRGKKDLLDYTQVTLDIAANDMAAVEQSGSARTPARLHHVCGHLVRRGEALFWRRAHMRGDPTVGVISNRTIMVKAG